MTRYKMISPFIRLFNAVKGRINAFTTISFIFLYRIILPVNQKKNNWLIGENRGECLKENGYWFYLYCRKHHPEQAVFFLVKTMSPFFKQELIDDPNVITYGSIRHAKTFVDTTVCLYTHTYRDVMYRRLFELFGKKKQLIYLHHGVLGFKKFNSFYHKHSNIMKLFTVGSSLEREILITQENVDKNRVKALGYARYDQLYNNTSDRKLQIVFIPTHRNYIKGNFTNSILFHRVKSFLRNKKLAIILKENDIVLKVYLHKEMQPHSDKFICSDSHIKIIKLGEETPQQLLSESHFMITDYSSVSWDFFYLGKPVVFYRFDIEEYTRDRDSYIDLYDDIIGDVVFEETELIATIIDYINKKFIMKTKYSTYRDEIVPNIDHNNSHRIYNEIMRLQYQEVAIHENRPK